MHPALSIVAFTTLTGMGFGLMAFIGLGAGPDDAAFAWRACVVCGAFTAAGLGASSLHLRRPERAWRAFSQWRSSWLSREGILAAAAAGAFALYGALWIFAGERVLALGIVVAALAAATVFATSMIYAQLRTVPRWRTPLTPAAFLAFSAAGGALLAAALAPGAAPLRTAAGVAVILAWGIKLGWWIRAAGATRASEGASPEAATGLSAIGRVRQFEPPHTAPNYLLREMVHVVARRRSRAIRRLALGLGGVVPLALVLAATASGNPIPLAAAAAFYLLGTMFERWLFFAEAEHVVGAYYGHR